MAILTGFLGDRKQSIAARGLTQDESFGALDCYRSPPAAVSFCCRVWPLDRRTTYLTTQPED